MKNVVNYLLLFWLILGILSDNKHCDSRGGCNCNCGWARPNSCKNDDGSCCFACCCGSELGLSSSPSVSKPTGGSKETYCPSANDLIVAYGNAELLDQGWTVKKGGAAATKAAFNLLGGTVEFDIDFSKVPVGVNANIYTISPSGISSEGFDKKKNYCDGAKPAAENWCVEVDWIETNGNCGGATTLHTVPGPGKDSCTAWGCKNHYLYNQKSSFHMKITYDQDGNWTTYRDDQVISATSLKPAPKKSDWDILKDQYSRLGAVIYSSQWVGWVPVESCGTKSGDLDAATFSVRNLKITGSVIQGPTPRKCNSKKLKKKKLK